MKLAYNPNQGGGMLCKKRETSLLYVLSLTVFLSACHKPEEVYNMPLSGQVSLTRPRGKSIASGCAEVRVYDKKTFDAVLLDVKTKAEERKQSMLDAALQERERLEEEIRFSEGAKEHIEMVKETEEKAFSPYLGTYADQIRKDMLSLSNKLAALETSIQQDRKVLNDMANKESEAPHILSREVLVRNVLKALPKPLQEIESDAHGHFQVLLKNEDDYVVVTNASCEETGDIEFYRTSIHPANREAPSMILLSL